MIKIEECYQKMSLPKDPKDTDLTYFLLKPFAKARIFCNRGELEYRVIEPELDETDLKIQEKLHQGLLQVIDISPGNIKSRDELMEYLSNKINGLLKEYGIALPKEKYESLLYYIYRNFVGLNEIEALMHDDYIEDINCNGTETPVYIKHRILGNLKTNISFGDPESLKNLIIKLAQRCDKYITYSDPFLEGSLPDGSRVQGTISEEISPRGPNFSIRKFRRAPFSPIEFMDSGTIPAETMAYLWLLIEQGANILIIGGTGAGKTTFLNVIANFIPERSKIVSIEDTRELKLFHENWTATVAREAVGGMEIGEITLDKLLRESFRENPDYVIVGEVRGKETYIMFQGMASGHPTIATFHSEDVPSVINRLKTPPISLPPALIELLDVVVTVQKIEKKNSIARKVAKIEAFEYIDDNTGRPVTEIISAWDSKTDKFSFSAQGSALKKISERSGKDAKEIGLELKKRKAFLERLAKRGITEIGAVHEEIEKYYTNN
jgi:flagellar protein FlaI